MSKLYQTRDVIGRVLNPDGKPGAARCYFPAKRLGTLVWAPVLEIPLAESTGLLDARAGCTVSGKVFFKHDGRGNLLDDPKKPQYGSAFVRCELLLSERRQPRPYLTAARPPGILIGLGSGENVCEVDNRRPYYQPLRLGFADLAKIGWGAYVLTLMLAVSSGDAREGDPVSPDYLEACAEHPEGPASDDEYAFIDATVTP